jgi:hypothetical protein
LVYTVDDVKAITDYAADRGIAKFVVVLRSV